MQQVTYNNPHPKKENQEKVVYMANHPRMIAINASKKEGCSQGGVNMEFIGIPVCLAKAEEYVFMANKRRRVGNVEMTQHVMVLRYVNTTLIKEHA